MKTKSADLLHSGKNLSDEQKYENAIWLLHPKGKILMTVAEQKSKRVSRDYAKWSEENEGHTREAGKAAYSEIHARHFGK